MATNPKPANQITEVTEEVDPLLVEVDDYDPAGDDISFPELEHGDQLTKTDYATRRHVLEQVETVDQIIDLGVETLDPEAETHTVRVHTDVGPIYYGDTNRPIELKKNRRYQVPSSIHRYLYERGLLVDQLSDIPI